jgi:AcrR family transcriptional regulator
MTPRKYISRRRAEAAKETRSRIIEAARDLVLNGGRLSMTEVARHADVARMTVYHQFGSKLGLLEAIYNDLATRGLVGSLRASFEAEDALVSLDELVAAFGHFWASDRVIIRRLRALAVLDPDFEGARERDERRRDHFRRVVARVADEYGRPDPESAPHVVDLLTTLAGFETFDALAGETRSPDEVVPEVQRLAALALGVVDERPHV